MIFLAGFAGSFHCIGMCGGFACALGTSPTGSPLAKWLRHLIYNTGRVVTYVFLGAMVGLLADRIKATGTLSSAVIGQHVLTLLAGSLMVIMALQIMGAWRIGRSLSGAGLGSTVLVVSLRSLLATRHRGAPLAFGAINGFLPCPLVYAFIAQAAVTASALEGAALMATFGLGTFPAMLLMGWLGRVLQPAWRQWGVRVAGFFILVLGLVTLARVFISPDTAM